MCFGVYICIFTLCFMFIAANTVFATLDIKTRDVPTISSINSLLSQYCKNSHFFANFYVLGGVGGGANCSLCPGCPMGKGRPSAWTEWSHQSLLFLFDQCERILCNIQAWYSVPAFTLSNMASPSWWFPHSKAPKWGELLRQRAWSYNRYSVPGFGFFSQR
jgi:hypothetical protein